MENTIVKKLPIEVQKRIDAVVESEFDLDIRVFTLAPNESEKLPQAVATIWSCSCATCQLASCWTCTCGPICAERLRNPDTVTVIAQIAAQQSTGYWGWSPASLSSGFGSTALLFLFLARSFPGEGWEDVARQHLRLASQSTHQQPFIAPGIFGGSSGLASVVSFLAQNDKRYYQRAHTLNEQVAEQVLQTQWQREQSQGVADADYDAIAGVSGILGFLSSIDQPGTNVHAAIQKLLSYLIWLACDDEEHKNRRWFLPPDLYPIELHRKSYPNGYFNCGLAHGIPGPLTAMAIAWHAGYRIPGQSEAMFSLAQWIIDHRLRDAGGINWPSGIPLEQSYSSAEWNSLPSYRTAWCYGTPGISRALWLAGTALDDTDLCAIASTAIESVLQRPIAARGVDSVNMK